MNTKIEFHPDVFEDIRGSYKWYEEKLTSLGGNFLNEIENGLISIQNFPDMWCSFEHDFKRYILSKFPFSIIYKYRNNTIFVVAIMHNSRKPNYWKTRSNEHL
jgi:hypothetical protein